MDKKKKFDPKKTEPDDTVDTIYCGENKFDNIADRCDMFPYISPLPKSRRTPEPPII